VTRQRGFTLLELLVALGIFVLLAGLAFGALRLGGRVWEAGDRRIEASDVMRVGWRFLQRALNGAEALPSLEPGRKGVHFVGTPQSLEFIAEMPGYLGTGGLYLVRLAGEPDPERPGQRRLVLRRILASRYRPDLADDAWQQAVLVPSLEGLQLAYYGSDENGAGGDWQDRWEARSRLPKLVRVGITPAQERPWPLLIAHPRLGQDRKLQEGETAGLEADGGDGARPAGGEAEAGAPP